MGFGTEKRGNTQRHPRRRHATLGSVQKAGDFTLTGARSISPVNATDRRFEACRVTASILR